MKHFLNLFSVIFLIMFSLPALAGNNNNNPVDCPPVSMVANTKFTLARNLAGPIWVLYSRLNFKPNENWILVFANTFEFNNNINEQEALRKGQEKYQTLPLVLIDAYKDKNGTECVYYQHATNNHKITFVSASNRNSSQEFPAFVKKLI